MALSQAVLDELWDFGDPVASEARLRAAVEAETDAATRAELETQVARALGLQERFDEADALLSTLPVASPVVSVRIALERGRLRNSSGAAESARPLFELAAEVAASASGMPTPTSTSWANARSASAWTTRVASTAT